MRYNTGNPVEPDGSSDPRDLYDNAGNIDLFANGSNPSYLDRKGVSRKSIRGMEQDFSDFLANSGFESAFIPYGAGVVVARYTQLVQRDGELYRVSDQSELPLTLTGTWATDEPKLVAVGDAALRSGLAALDSAVSIAGVPAWQLALLGKADDYTTIRSGLRKIGASICGIGPQPSIVITGDSLAFNAFGYVGWPTAGAAYATDNPFGLSSWAHMMRDLFFTSCTAFVPIQDVDVSTDAQVAYLNSLWWNFAINQKVVSFYFADTEKKAVLRNPYSGAKCLIVSYAPASEAVLFEVDGTQYDNSSPDGAYQSRGFFIVPHSGEYATVSNVRLKTGGGGGNLWFYGVGDSQRTPARLTGKGAWTSGQILAEYSTLVEPYAPDCIFYIIGANDIGQGVSISQFSQNLTDFIATAMTDKPGCEIVLISSPPTTSYDRATAKSYIKAMRVVADAQGCSLVDLYSNLEQIDPEFYRFDNIHFKRQGDTLVFNIIKSLVFPEIPVDYGKFTPDREAMLGAFGNFYRKPRAKISLSALVNCGASPTVVQYLGNPEIYYSLTIAYSGSGVSSVLNITPPFGFVVDSIENLTLGNASAARLKVQSLGAGGAVVVEASNSSAGVDIVSSGLYALVNYRQF